MDLLGSIMNAMDKPPTTMTEDQKKKNKEQQQVYESWKKKEDHRISVLKGQIRKRISDFVNDASAQKLKFEPMSLLDRAIVKEIADHAGLVNFSFGQEEVDRHVVIWKKEFAPTDDEVSTLRSGEEWTDQKAEAIRQRREVTQAIEKERQMKPSRVPPPKADYHKKYTHLISLETGKDSAQDVTTKKQYGNVPAKNKTDKRTIEETMADRRAKKYKNEDTNDNKGENV